MIYDHSGNFRKHRKIDKRKFTCKPPTCNLTTQRQPLLTFWWVSMCIYKNIFSKLQLFTSIKCINFKFTSVCIFPCHWKCFGNTLSKLLAIKSRHLHLSASSTIPTLWQPKCFAVGLSTLYWGNLALSLTFCRWGSWERHSGKTCYSTKNMAGLRTAPNSQVCISHLERAFPHSMHLPQGSLKILFALYLFIPVTNGKMGRQRRSGRGNKEY